MTKSIEIQNLFIGYRSSKNTKVVAKGLNACLNKGELTCLLGSNGTGKSTLIRTVCGFLKPLSGMVNMSGKGMALLNESELAKLIAIVLTEKIAVPNATVFELVALGRSPFTGFLGRLSLHDKEKINKSIELCGISHKKHSLVSSLSDGERQKATIAKALAQDTPIIILDEPTAFLDLPARVEVMQLLRKLATNEDKSILMSTHDLDLALQMSDRLWLLQKEAVIAGSPEDLLLKNAFQSMFVNNDIQFDNKTGMFKVAHNYTSKLPVQGHGFEYILLRKALLRKGVKPVRASIDDPFFVKIINDAAEPFELWDNNILVEKTNGVEQVVKDIIRALAYQNVYN